MSDKDKKKTEDEKRRERKFGWTAEQLKQLEVIPPPKPKR